MATILLEKSKSKHYNYSKVPRKSKKGGTEKNIFYKKLIALVFPIAIQNLMTALVSASDALMLGFLDQTALSAVSLATQVQFVLNLFLSAITIGTTVLAAQYWGKQDRESVEEVLSIALKMSIFISVIHMLLLYDRQIH